MSLKTDINNILIIDYIVRQRLRKILHMKKKLTSIIWIFNFNLENRVWKNFNLINNNFFRSVNLIDMRVQKTVSFYLTLQPMS